MKNSPDNAKKNVLEWTVFGISTLLVLAAIIHLLYSALTVRQGPARLTVSAGEAVEESGRTRVPVTVHNSGQQVAANVEVRICIGSGDQRQVAGFTLDFVPRDATRRGSVSFTGTGLPDKPECEVLGYEEP